MQSRLKLRFRRKFRKSQKQVEDLSLQAEQQIERHVFKRFGRLSSVRRFVFSWVGLIVLLIAGVIAQNVLLSGYYQTVRTVPGGIYTEGVLGSFTNASPLYATRAADASVSRLLFSGLLRYDNNGTLVGDLASGYSVDQKGLTYTVQLKPNLTWHDGQPLTSSDVVFTYKAIQNPDAQSPLQSSWRDIEVTAPNPQTVVFKLASPLASFAYNLTNGIVPQHILGKVPAADLRSTDFNTVHPVGSGPFKWQALEVSGDGRANSQEQIALVPFDKHVNGKPQLQEFIIHTYTSQEQLVSAFQKNQITAVSGLTAVPKKLEAKNSVQQHSLPLKAANMVFFKTTSGVLASQKVRQALVQSADVPKIIDNLGYPVRAVREPFLNGQLGYDPALAQSGFNLVAAQKSLDADGWIVGKRDVRYKDGKPLMFVLSAANTPENKRVTNQLCEQWRRLGVDLQVQLQSPTDFQSALTYHSYDAVLYGISIGSDPDVFVYWDSSQADIRSNNRLNFSEYKNTAADLALEAGRTRLDPQLRTLKYRPFLAAWQQDAPALGLYQPRSLYLTSGSVNGLNDHTLTTPTDRFDNVWNWQIRQAKVTN